MIFNNIYESLSVYFKLLFGDLYRNSTLVASFHIPEVNGLLLQCMCATVIWRSPFCCLIEVWSLWLWPEVATYSRNLWQKWNFLTSTHTNYQRFRWSKVKFHFRNVCITLLHFFIIVMGDVLKGLTSGKQSRFISSVFFSLHSCELIEV